MKEGSYRLRKTWKMVKSWKVIRRECLRMKESKYNKKRTPDNPHTKQGNIFHLLHISYYSVAIELAECLGDLFFLAQCNGKNIGRGHYIFHSLCVYIERYRWTLCTDITLLHSTPIQFSMAILRCTLCSHFESSMFIRPTEWERNGKHAPQRVAINMAFMYFHQELNNLEKWNDRYFEIGTAQIKSGEQLHADTFHSRSIYFCTIALSAETTWKWTQVQFQPPVKTMRP